MTTGRHSARVLALLAGMFLALVVRGEPVERDAGEGLVYFRVRQVPSDLPNDAMLAHRPCVLDLRYAIGDAAAGDVLGSWLKFHASSKAPFFVLVNGATSPNLQSALGLRDSLGGVLTIGIAGQRFEPDITVAQSPGAEEQAYFAFEKGASIAVLTTDNPEKLRNDEASLAHERTLDPADPDAPPAEEHAGKPAPLVDAALQRAIHLHRALKAMKRL